VLRARGTGGLREATAGFADDQARRGGASGSHTPASDFRVCCALTRMLTRALTRVP
jgi:hypothetical protein